MYKTTAAILFSLILLPVNLFCVFWMFREALFLTGFTFKKFLSCAPYISDSQRHPMRRRKKFLAEFFRSNSSDPEVSLRLLQRFMLSTLLGLAALLLAQWAAFSPEHTDTVLLCDVILAAVNIGLFLLGKSYRRNHPLDEALEKALEQERSAGRSRKNIIVYTLVGAMFFGFLAFFHLKVASFTSNGDTNVDSETVYKVLQKNGYETNGIPVTYWYLKEENLMYVCAGVSDGSKFEFYSYTDSETAENIYLEIRGQLFPDMSESQIEHAETVFSDGTTLFSTISNGAYQFIVKQGKTMVYAYSSNSPDQIRDILSELGYLGR